MERNLKLPKSRDAMYAYVRAAQAYYKDRFPSIPEFAAFLEANADHEFDQGCYYDCAMGHCAGGSVGEGFQSDVDVNAPPWFRHFEKKTGPSGKWKGSALLEVLRQVEAEQ